MPPGANDKCASNYLKVWIYALKLITCGDDYVVHTCTKKDHLKDRRSKIQKSPKYCHDMEAHNGEPQYYKTRILTREKSIFPLSLTEGFYIEGQVPGTSINERNDSGRGLLVRLSCLRVSSKNFS